MNITTKIALVVTTIIAITMGIVISMAVSDAEEILRSQLEHSLAVKVSYFDTWLGQHALQIERTAEVIAHSPDIARGLDLDISRGLSSTLNRTIAIYPTLSYMLVLDSEGYVFAANSKDATGRRLNSEQLLGEHISERMESFELASKVTTGPLQEDPFSVILRDTLDAEAIQWITAPVLKRGAPIGWVLLAYRWQHDLQTLLTGSLAALSNLTDRDPGIAVELVDQTGRITVSTLGRTGKLFRPGDDRIWKSHKILPGGTEIRLVVSADITMVTEPIGIARTSLIQTMTLGTILLVAILLFVLRHLLLRKIQILHQSVNHFREGHFENQVDLPGTDEISMLGHNFNAMARLIDQALKELKKHGEELESEVSARTLELRQSNRDLDDFAYIASHDLKEPLRGIHSYSSFLIEDYAHLLDKDGQEKLNSLMTLTKHMESLIDSMLKYSRVGQSELELKPVDINSRLAEVLESLKFSLDEHAVEVRIPRPLPTVLCDAAAVGELYRNLITNAMKYNDKTEPWIEIGYLDAGDETGPPVFYVKDNGIGIRQKHQYTIFRMFKRLHGRKRYGGGTGIGLNIVKRIIERHRGEIWVESEYGVGATFFFTLPPPPEGVITEASAGQVQYEAMTDGLDTPVRKHPETSV